MWVSGGDRVRGVTGGGGGCREWGEGRGGG